MGVLVLPRRIKPELSREPVIGNLRPPPTVARSLASMGRFAGVTDVLTSLFVQVPELCPAARFFGSRQTLMPEREQPHFHVTESKPR